MTEPLRPAAPLSSPPPAPLLAVDRAAAELRRGGPVVLVAPEQAPLLIQSVEGVTADSLERLVHLSGQPLALCLTARRTRLIGLDPGAGAVAALTSDLPLSADRMLRLADPGTAEDMGGVGRIDDLSVTPLTAGSVSDAGVQLAKIARLLPGIVSTPVACAETARHWAASRNLLVVEAAAVLGYAQTAARSLRLVGEARVPLVEAENTRILAFRPADGGIEHLAIVIGAPDPEQPVLARLHSECFTGDLLGSLRCDCGDQLRGAIDAIHQAGSGVLLYLAQEGRGIGLVNKLRAYRLQDAGYDTMDANGQLGFDDDERVYLPAAEMLRLLGYSRIRLMTNNPFKVDALSRHGVQVEERVPHVFETNTHNLSYLRTKALKGGHLF